MPLYQIVIYSKQDLQNPYAYADLHTHFRTVHASTSHGRKMDTVTAITYRDYMPTHSLVPTGADLIRRLPSPGFSRNLDLHHVAGIKYSIMPIIR